MADRYWIANLEANQLWTTATNWADNANGTGANTVPVANDNVHFGHPTTLAAGKGFGSCELAGATATLAKFTSYEGYNKIEMTSKFSIVGATRLVAVSPVGSTSPLQAGFKVGMVITIAGCADADNNGLFQIATLGAGIMTLTTAGSGSSMANETAGNDVTITYDPLLDLKGQSLNMTSPAGGTLMTLNSKIGNGTGTGTINFSGAYVGGAGNRYLLCGDKQALANVDSITMSFTPSGVLYFDDGIYGTVQLNAGTYTCDYVTPTSAEHQGVYFYKLKEVVATTWGSGAGSIRNNIKKKFYVQNTTSFALSTKNFDTGQSTWCFDTDISFVIPTSGDYINYPTGFTVRWYNLIIKNSGGNTARKATIPARRNLQVNSLTVETGANVEGEKVESLSGTKYKGSSTITSNTRPTIKGSWNFSQVADGVYASLLAESYSITPSHGDRGALQFSYGGGAFHSQSKINLVMDAFETDWDATAWLQACDGAYFKSSFYAFCQAYDPAIGAGNDTIWISNGSPSVPYFTDSAGTKHSLIGGGGGGMTSFDVAGTSGSAQTITNGNTLTIAAGTGITTTGSATDTVTIASTITQSTGANPSATIGATATNGSASTFMRSDGAPALETTGVTAATYGSATQSPVIAIDATGRITSASNANIPLVINTDQKVKINASDSAAGFLEDKIVAGTGLNTSLAIVAPHGTQLSLNNESLAFKTIAVAGQTDVVADGIADTLTLAAGSNMTITTNASTDTVTFASTGGGGGGGVTVQDEGVTLATTATTLNFVGAGVVASGTGATKTITIAGGGGAAGEVVEFVNSNTTINMNTTIAVCASNTDCTAKAGVVGVPWAGMTDFGANFENYDFTATSSIFGAAHKGLVDVPVPTVGRKLTLVVPFPCDGRSLEQGITQITCTGQAGAFIGHDLAGMVDGGNAGKATSGSNVILPEFYLFGAWNDAGRRLNARSYLGHHAITLVGVPAPTGNDAAMVITQGATMGDVVDTAKWWVETNNEFLWDSTDRRNAPRGFFDDRAFQATAWGQLYVVC